LSMTVNRARPPFWWILPAAIFLISMAATQPPFTGDSVIYADQIAEVRTGFATHQALWEFGHILWRPLGYWFSFPGMALIPDRLAWTPSLKILSGMIGISLFAGLVCTLLVCAFAFRFTGSWRAALIVSVLFVWSDSVLAYSQTGCPYVPALALLLAGLWWQLGGPLQGTSTVIGPACLFGLAALLWFPFAIALPAACCAGRFLEFPGSPRPKMSWRECIAAALISGIVLLGGIATAAWLAGVGSVPELVSWVVSAGHGMQQNRRWLRAVSGFSRLMIDLGPDGVYLKRFILHDPYYPLSLMGVFSRSLWKVVVFYVFVASSFALMWRSSTRRMSVPLVIAGAAGVFAAVFVFEPSSPERLLPVFPFFLIALSAAWMNSRPWSSALRTAAGVFAGLLIVLNLPTFEWQRSAEYREARTQLLESREHAKSQDLLLETTMAEPVSRLALNPFDPVNRAGPVRCSWILSPMDKDAARWRLRAARSIQAAWQAGDDVWVTKAVFAGRPDPSSLWVDGDNLGLRWIDVPAFFGRLEFDMAGQNAFARILPSQANRELLSSQ
jgi:hypothetical protein